MLLAKKTKISHLASEEIGGKHETVIGHRKKMIWDLQGPK
jgi:hypothetical protein